MKITVLDRASLGADTPFEILDQLGCVELHDATSSAEIKDRIADSDVIVINKIKVTEDVIKNAPRLKLICVFATGYDNVDVDAARKYGVGVCNVPAYSSDSVALMTVSTVLALASHIIEYRDFVSSGEYTASGTPNKLTPVFHELRGLTWGIVGYGNIGRAVARVAEAFGTRVIVNKRTPTDEAECVDIDTLCRESDIITLHCPLNDGTRELINERRLSLMKASVILVNEARGAVLDELAVTNAIINGQIAGFGCDVYSSEPFSREHPYGRLLGKPNVILTPHAAWGAYEARVRCIKVIADNIASFVRGERLNRVD